MTRKLASHRCTTILALLAAGLLIPGATQAEWCGAFSRPLQPSDLAKEVFPRGEFTAVGLSSPAAPAASVTFDRQLIIQDVVFNDVGPILSQAFVLTHQAVTAYPGGITPQYTIAWQKDGVPVSAATSRNWFTVTPDQGTGVTLAPIESQEYFVNFSNGSTSVSSLEPGLYTATITFTTPRAGSTDAKLGDVIVGLAVDSSVTGYLYGLGSFDPVQDPQIYLRVAADNINDFNAFAQFVPLSGTTTTIALYHGNAVGSDGFAMAPGSNKDMSVLFSDDAPGLDVSGAYDRSVPAITGRWAPAQLNTWAQSGTDVTVAGALTDDLKFGLDSNFSGKTNGSFRLVMYSDSGDDAFSILEACMLPSPTIEGDLDPRGFTLGGPELLRVMNVTDQILSGLHLLGFERLDLRLTPPAISNVASLLQPLDIYASGTTPNPALDASAGGPLARGFDPVDAAPLDYLNNYAFSLAGGYGLEFSKLDVAPESSNGDGLITVADFAQLGRYVAGNGFPLPPTQNGPLSPGERTVYLGEKGTRLSLIRGTVDSQLPEIPVRLRSKGNEQTVALSVEYDAELLEFVSARRNGREVDIPNFEIQNDTVSGVIGIEVGLRPNRVFPLLDPNGAPHNPTTYPITPGTDGVFSTGDGFNADETIAFLKFRPKEGTGAVNTELKITQSGATSLNGREPSVRIPSGAPISAFFISSGITILDQLAEATRVRIADKVLVHGDGIAANIPSTGEIQRLDVVVDSTGLENALGFTLEFNPADLDIFGIEPGDDLPNSAFFQTNPDFDHIRSSDVQRADFAVRTDEAGKLRVLIGLQPGQVLPEGRNVIASLQVKARNLPAGTDQAVTTLRFAPLGDTLEVVDANAIPVASTFGKTGDRTDTVTIVSNACEYAVTVEKTGAAAGSSVDFDLNGGSGTLNITPTTAQCSWTANVNYTTPGQSGWLSFRGFPDGVPNGLGAQKVEFDVTPFAGAGSRSAQIQVVGQTVTVTQTGCGVTVELLNGVSPTEAAFSGLSGTGTIRITALSSECEWSAISSSPWITFAQTSGKGSLDLVFNVAQNRGEARVGLITVGGVNVTVRQDFTFATSAEGWEAFPGFPTSDFTFATGTFEPGAGGTDGRLTLTTANNTNTFGFFTSPLFEVANTPDALYRATFRVTTDQANSADAPTFRLRASTGDFSQTSEFQVESTTSTDPNASFAPNTTGRIYEHYFTLPPSQSQLRLYFDVINFSGLNAPIAKLNLESMAVTAFSRSQDLLDRRVDLPGLVAANVPFQEIGVRPHGVSEANFADPVFLRDSRGASIRSSNTDPASGKYSVGLITAPAGVSLEGSRLYEIVFQVSARSQTATTIRKEKVPAFRLRVNEASFQLSSLINIESISETSVIPTFQQNVRYPVWFPSNPLLNGRPLSVSLDYIVAPDSLNDPAIAVVLEKVEIYSYARPE
ncbi:hypothetical protein GC173_13215 [bacterium]|nr:hypothetical protein [bacterium]